MIRFIFDSIALQCFVLGPVIGNRFPVGSSGRSVVYGIYMFFVGIALCWWLADYLRELVGRYRAVRRFLPGKSGT
jgi:hypothetical protein